MDHFCAKYHSCWCNNCTETARKFHIFLTSLRIHQMRIYIPGAHEVSFPHVLAVTQSFLSWYSTRYNKCLYGDFFHLGLKWRFKWVNILKKQNIHKHLFCIYGNLPTVRNYQLAQIPRGWFPFLLVLYPEMFTPPYTTKSLGLCWTDSSWPNLNPLLILAGVYLHASHISASCNSPFPAFIYPVLEQCNY